MKMLGKISLSLALTLSLSGLSSFAYQQPTPLNPSNYSTPIQADIQSLKIPRGTMIKLRLQNTPVNSLNSNRGTPFLCTVTDDIRVANSIILPAGTAVRGNVELVKRSSYFSRAGQMKLSFDHIVTPVGREVPIKARVISYNNTNANGTMVAEGGYFDEFQKGIDHGVNVFGNITKFSVDKGLAFGKGIPVILTAPLGVATGGAAGSIMFVKDSIKAMISKGKNVISSPGDTFDVVLVNDVDIPLN